MNRRTLTAAGLATAAFAAVAASAASLGGLNAGGLGADASVIAACDSDGVTLSYSTSYSATTDSYVVDSVTLDGVATACAGQSYRITLGDDASALAEVTGTVPTGGGPVTASFSTKPDAEAATRAAVIISG